MVNEQRLVALRTRARPWLDGALNLMRRRGRSSASYRGSPHGRNKPAISKLRLDPVVGPLKAFFEGDLRLPPQHATQPRVVAIAAAYALRLGEIVPLGNTLAGYARHYVDQFIDADESILTQVQRLSVI